MDLNPYEFTAPWEAMEFANHCMKKNTDIIVFLTNWLDNKPDDTSDSAVMDILNYWLNRLEPFLKRSKPVYFLASNRSGKERETTFIGCSGALKVCKNPRLLGNLTKNEENSLLVKFTI